MSDASASPEMSLEIAGSYKGVGGGGGGGGGGGVSTSPTVTLLISSCATVVSADTGTPPPPTSEGEISRIMSAEGRSVRVGWLYTAP